MAISENIEIQEMQQHARWPLGDAVLGRHGGFGSGLKFRCFERIDIDDVGWDAVGWVGVGPRKSQPIGVKKKAERKVCEMG